MLGIVRARVGLLGCAGVAAVCEAGVALLGAGVAAVCEAGGVGVAAVCKAGVALVRRVGLVR